MYTIYVIKMFYIHSYCVLTTERRTTPFKLTMILNAKSSDALRKLTF